VDNDSPRQTPIGGPAASGWLLPGIALGLAVVVALAWAVVKPKTSAMSVPVPTAVASEPSPSPTVFTGTEGITFNFEHGKSMPYRSARVEVRRYNHDLAIKVSLTGDRRASLAEVDGRSTVSVASDMPVMDGKLEFAVIPGYVKNVASLNHGRIQIVYLANVGVSALAIERDPKNTAKGFFWSDYAGGIHNHLNETVPSATVVAGDYAITVYEDVNLGVWGYFDGGVNGLEPIAREPADSIRAITFAESSGYFSYERLSWLGLLPSGATDPDVVADRSVKWASAPLGGTGRLVIAGYTEVVDTRRTGVRSFSYTDASGTRRTVRP
jgi:hypothetical protein